MTTAALTALYVVSIVASVLIWSRFGGQDGPEAGPEWDKTGPR